MSPADKPLIRVFTLDEVLRLNGTASGVWRSDCLGDPGWGAVFGGQILAQAVVAAGHEAGEGWSLHSLHALFMRPGDPHQPLQYGVQQLRQGRAFQTLRVSASQSRGVCADVTLSYQRLEAGQVYQRSRPLDFEVLPAPETLPDYLQQLSGTALAQSQPAWYGVRRGLDIRLVNSAHTAQGPSADDGIRFWVRTDPAVMHADFALQEAALAYCSDECLSDSLLVPFGRTWDTGQMQVASLDHVMWFHRPFDLRQWHFVEQRPLAAHGARGTSLAHVWRQDGELVATFAQEALLRI